MMYLIVITMPSGATCPWAWLIQIKYITPTCDLTTACEPFVVMLSVGNAVSRRHLMFVWLVELLEWRIQGGRCPPLGLE